MISGKIIFNFEIAERLRTLRYLIFTGGVVKETGICSACFLRKRQRCGEYPLSLLTTFAASSPKGEQARPQALHLSLKLYRHAKGSLPEGAGKTAGFD